MKTNDTMSQRQAQLYDALMESMDWHGQTVEIAGTIYGGPAHLLSAYAAAVSSCERESIAHAIEHLDLDNYTLKFPGSDIWTAMIAVRTAATVAARAGGAAS